MINFYANENDSHDCHKACARLATNGVGILMGKNKNSRLWI